ncbi:methyltransferase domain-containing protein [Phaeovulum vinaykumarii]|uniref:Methyltransferase domain-containing protein n=1 Tax=Phaeovulum vinaykumarii TaxID=407234 RepID=A0A1N7KBK8_9RHOB|nr:methyltransferase domain-containing protein [Phaeovulum vinaykumarii]SIS58985.1 Methyltransferase domain-containing protein [Phaeovulum vinaykumarii]SOB93981.1 methyltransferase family protein [Phaeovulum vinaykumarii]
MTKPPVLTDRAALLRARSRAKAKGLADFLHDSAAVEIKERLNEVNRTFTDMAVVSGFPEFWGARFPQARQLADDPVLDLAPASLDLIVHALALHWADDPVGQVVQCARALRPDGLFIAVVPGGQTLAELRSCLAAAESRLTGGLSPRVVPMGEIRDLGGVLPRAGLALPVADVVNLTASYRDAWHLMRDLRAMGETNALAARRRTIPPRALFDEASRLYSLSFGDDDGRVRASFDLVFLTGWAPHESQQKPLPPGGGRWRGTGPGSLPEAASNPDAPGVPGSENAPQD